MAPQKPCPQAMRIVSLRLLIKVRLEEYAGSLSGQRRKAEGTRMKEILSSLHPTSFRLQPYPGPRLRSSPTTLASAAAAGRPQRQTGLGLRRGPEPQALTALTRADVIDDGRVRRRVGYVREVEGSADFAARQHGVDADAVTGAGFGLEVKGVAGDGNRGRAATDIHPARRREIAGVCTGQVSPRATNILISLGGGLGGVFGRAAVGVLPERAGVHQHERGAGEGREEKDEQESKASLVAHGWFSSCLLLRASAVKTCARQRKCGCPRGFLPPERANRGDLHTAAEVETDLWKAAWLPLVSHNKVRVARIFFKLVDDHGRLAISNFLSA